MKSTIVSGVALLSLLIAPLASAQTYYSPVNCVSTTVGLSVGSRGSDVTNLQSFLVSRAYPGGGTWMITGYFGRATTAALRNFQQSQGLPQTGMTDVSTAAAISRITCATASIYPALTPTYPYTYPNTYPTPNYITPLPAPAPYLPYNYNYNYGAAPTITSLSQNTGTAGNVVTVYGVGFDLTNNTVNFAGTILSGIPAYNGTSLSFTIPSNVYSYSLAGTAVQLSVSNSRGTSNALSFTVWGGQSGCGSYQYGGTYPNNSCGCAGNTYYPYNTGYLPTGQAGNSVYCPQPNTALPVISYLSPQSGAVGTNVSVYGSGFSTSGNTLHFGTGIMTNLNSYDGHSVSFTVPSTLIGYGTQPITLSTYQVSVSNNSGYTSNAMPFTVTSTGSSGAPTITSANGPANLAIGAQGLWTLVLNTLNNQYLTVSVNWGDQGVYGSSAAPQTLSSALSQTTQFTHTYYTAGTYTIVFTVANSAGQQNIFTTTVVVGSAVYNPYPQTTSVSIANFAFNPSVITVKAGSTIVWTNNDSTAHTVTSDTSVFGSGTLSQGQSFNYTFNTPGTYTYHCAIHPMMTGTVVVTQ